jgi:hypothetical protein
MANKTLKSFDIFENGIRFATIEAVNATAALRKTAKSHPRRAVDYNMHPEDPAITVTWYAAEVGVPRTASNSEHQATAEIRVPGIGLRGCKF